MRRRQRNSHAVRPGAALFTNRGSPRVTNEHSAHVVRDRKHCGTPRRRRARFFSQPPPPVNEVIRKLGPGLVCRFSVVRGFFSCRSAKDTPLLRSGVESALNKERIRFSNAMRRKSKSGTAFQDLPFCEAVRKAKIISAGFS